MGLPTPPPPPPPPHAKVLRFTSPLGASRSTSAGLARLQSAAGRPFLCPYRDAAIALRAGNCPGGSSWVRACRWPSSVWVGGVCAQLASLRHLACFRLAHAWPCAVMRRRALRVNRGSARSSENLAEFERGVQIHRSSATNSSSLFPNSPPFHAKASKTSFRSVRNSSDRLSAPSAVRR